jgi:hypothetical protein
MTNPTSNGNAQRKQLSAQLDRLDTVLGSLADALNRSVADAVKDVVGQVVKEAVETTLKEVLGTPDLLHAALAEQTPLQPLVSQPVGKNPSAGQWLGGAVQAAWGWASRKSSQACGVIRQVARTCACAVASRAMNAWARVQSMASGVRAFCCCCGR